MDEKTDLEMKKGWYCCFLLGLMLLVSASVSTSGEERPAPNKKRCVSPGAANLFLQSASPRSSARTTAGIYQEANVVVVEADPDLLILSNVFDLMGQAIHFQPAIRYRYTYSVGPATFDGQATQSLTLKDDDSYELIFENFLFPLGKKKYDRCYINSNGNITFESPDPDPPNAENLLQGPPRIAAIFADLDPETAGTIFVSQASEKITISWLRVPEFFNQNQFGYGQNTFQIVLNQDGRIDLVFSQDVTATQGVTGIVPGSSKSPLKLVDFSRGTSKSHPSISIVENFHDYESVDIPRLMKSLYGRIKDSYDFVTLFSNFDLTPVPGALAFAINVRNTTSGIGDPSEKGTPIFRENGTYGSKKNLENITFLGNIHQYPLNPSEEIPAAGTSLLGILAHELGHRWLTYIKISRDGAEANTLLGRDQSHWSFFLDTDGSFLEGNQIVQRNSSSFVTQTPYRGYSDLDLYLMGLLPSGEVRDTFLVEGARDFSPKFTFSAESAPENNVTFKGTAFPVRVAEIIAANGVRRPSASSSEKSFYHLFVLITKQGLPATPEELAYVEFLRTQWELFFQQATRGRATIDTRLQ